MNEQPLLQQMEKWGYFFLPKTHPESPGYTGLLVAIRDKPTGMHFDPVSLHLKLCQDGRAKDSTLHLNAPVSHTMPVSPGRVIVRDHKGKEVEAFTFGGSLETVSVPGETVYSLRSAAPILFITSELECVADQLAFEVEALLARYAARWGLNQDGFLCLLGGLNTEQFYLACLEALLARFEESRALRKACQPLYYALRHEKHWYEETDNWPAALPGLETLMAPTDEYNPPT